MGGEWQCTPFSEAVRVNPRVILKRGEVYPFVDMQSLDPSKPTVAPARLRKFTVGGSKFEPYDTLMARITPCLENGKIARYVPDDEHHGPAFGSTEFIVIRGREGVTNNDFAFYLTRWSEFRAFAIAQMSGSSGRQRVPAESLSGFEVPVPPLPEQRAIAHILGTLDDKIELNRRMNQTLEAMAQALFKSWFVDFDPVVVNALKAGNPIPDKFAERAAMYGRPAGRPDDALGLPEHILRLFPDRFVDSELGPIPEGWEVESLYDICDLIGGGTPKTSVAEYWNGHIPWFSVVDAPVTADVFVIDTEKHVTEAGVKNSSTKILPVGTTIISARGTVGKCALVGVPMAMNQSCYGIRGKGGVSDSFVYYTIRFQVSDLQRSGHGSVFNTITRETFKSIIVPFCGKDLTQMFENSVNSLMAQIRDNLFQTKTLASLRDTLLPKLISGELRVPDVEKILEDAL